MLCNNCHFVNWVAPLHHAAVSARERYAGQAISQAASAHAATVSAQAATLSAYAAYAAAGAALLLAAIQAYVGHRQTTAAIDSAKAAIKTAESAGRHRVATFRQAWIDKVMDTLAEYHSIVMVARHPPSIEDLRAQEALHTKLEILLNPTEEDTIALLAQVDLVTGLARIGGDQEIDDSEMVAIARRLLKAEWKRIKTELE